MVETSISKLDTWGEKDPMFKELAAIVQANGGLWCAEAEAYLLEHAPKI